MSARLLAVADMFGKNKYRCIADVGCDHGYVSICLVQREAADKAIAMDVKEGPLSIARENIRQLGLGGRIETRISDGLKGLREGEADGLVIAGMGGKLIMSILEHSDALSLGIKAAVLQPQSELFQFGEYLGRKGYSILDECTILDDGKYYFPMLVSFDRDHRSDRDSCGLYALSARSIRDRLKGNVPYSEIDTTLMRLCCRFGAINIYKGEDDFISFLEHEKKVSESVLSSLDEKQHPERFCQLRRDIDDILLTLRCTVPYRV